MPGTPRRCEYRNIAADPECKFRAVFRVSRPNRRHDAQDSCRRHVAATVEALAQTDTGLTMEITFIKDADRG